MNTDHSCGRRRPVSAASCVDDTRRYLAAARRRLPPVAALLAIALVVLPYSAAAGQALPAGPDYRYETKFATVDALNQFDVVQLILDFAPGAWTPEHFHGGPGFITVIDGEVTRRHDGIEETYKAGETWTEDAGDVHSAGNAGDAPASTAAIFLLPKGTPLTTLAQAASDQPLHPGPTYRFETKFEVANPPRVFDVVQLVLDFRPGAWTPPHVHGGPGFITIIDGEVTRRTPDGEQVFHSGDTWTEEGVHAAGNASDAPASTAAVFLLPVGARLTTPLPALVPE